MFENANIIREKRKTLKIVIEKNGEIFVVAPYNVELSKIQEILEKKGSWIVKKQKEVKDNLNANYNILNYKTLLICGKEFSVSKPPKIKKIQLNQATNEFQIPENHDEIKALKAIKRWYINLSKEILNQRINEISNITKISFKTLKIGDFRGKWGSCNQDKDIKLNWRLVMLEPVLIDFIICHELAHTKEMNHSQNFYKFLESFFPKWKESRKKLKKYDYLLQLYR